MGLPASRIALPRTAQEQYDAGLQLPPGAVLEPGDLVFFGTNFHNIDHVGIVMDTRGDMIDAPHTGTAIRVESIGTSVVGASRPASL